MLLRDMGFLKIWIAKHFSTTSRVEVQASSDGEVTWCLLFYVQAKNLDELWRLLLVEFEGYSLKMVGSKVIAVLAVSSLDTRAAVRLKFDPREDSKPVEDWVGGGTHPGGRLKTELTGSYGKQDGCPGIHHLKSYPQYYSQVLVGAKPFEIRLDDRGFRVGDLIDLHEWDPELGGVRVADGYSGRSVRGKITCVVRLGDLVALGLDRGVNNQFVVLGVMWDHQR